MAASGLADLLGQKILIFTPSGGTYYLIIFFLSIVIFLTPAQIEVGSAAYAPALFSFLFDVFLEKDYSLRALRPLVLSIPLSCIFLFLFFYFKKKFF